MPLLLAVAGLAVFLLIQVADHVAWVIGFPYEGAGWGEGYFLHSAIRLSRGEDIFVDPAREPVATLPYGFLYPLVLAPLVRLCGPELWIGRAVSAAAAMMGLVWVFRTAAARANSPTAGVWGIGLVATTYYLCGSWWASGHADSLCLALGLWSLWCIDCPPPHLSRPRLALAVVLSCGSCFAKQTGAGFILAVATSLLVRRRCFGLAYLAGSALLAGTVVGIGHFLSDGQYERYMIMVLSDPYSPDRILPLLVVLIQTVPLVLTAAVWQIKRDFPRSGWADPVIWAVLWVGLASLSAYVKQGGWINNLMPPFFMMSALAGTRLSQMMGTARSSGFSLRSVALAAMVGQVLIIHLVSVPEAARLKERLSWPVLRVGRQIDAELCDPNVRAWMADRISFAVRASRPVYDSVSIIRIGYDKGLVPGRISAQMVAHIQERLKKQLAGQFFDKVLVPKDDLDALRPDVLSVLRDNYRLDHVIGPQEYVWPYLPMLVFKPVRNDVR